MPEHGSRERLVLRYQLGRKGGELVTTAYCVKCRKKVNIQNERPTKLKSGRTALAGTCPNCGTKVMRFTKK